MDNYNKYDWVFYMEWFATAILVIGVVFTSFNIYPINLYLSLAGNLALAIVGWQWRKWSLLVTQGTVTVIYLAGIYSVWK
jgi:hypothetical protein